jgi:cobalt-zinc-cadmium efflux system outer membrane protein
MQETFMRKQVAVALLVGCATTTFVRAQAGPALAVRELVDLAMQRNRDLAAARHRVAETQGLLRQAGVRPAPAIEVEQSAGRPLGSPGERVFSAGYFHTIETFGKRGKRLSVAQKTAEVAEAELAERVRQLTLDVKLRYAQAIREQQKLEAMQRLAATSREYAELTAARVQHGDAPALEGQLFLAEFSRVNAQQVLLGGSATRAMLQLRKVVGLAAADPLTLAPSPPQPATSRSLVDLQAQAVRDRPDLRVLQKLEEQAAAERALVHAEGKTDITASVRYSRVDSSFDLLGVDEATNRLTPIQARDHMLGVGVSFLLFAPRRNAGAVEAAEARATAARLRHEHAESVVRLEVEAAYGRWQAAAGAVAILAGGVVAQSERNVIVLRQAYALGELRMFDVLNEQRRLIETQLAFLDAQSEVFEALAELEASVGGSIQ